MTAGVIGFIAVSMVVVAIFGVAGGFDPLALVLLVAIAACGALAIALAHRMRTGRIGPVLCGECGGAISSNAPYCKHCNAPR